MVQYIITPWRNRQELLCVRDAFYPPLDNESTRDQDRRVAVALVSVWVQRGNCPHSVESTALLIAAIMNETIGNSAYAMRAAYSAAFCRFVTGLLDSYQDKRHKLSMYSIAKNIGLPATFVELRHQCTHEELPSLPKLRAAAERSLVWIWDHYWKNIATYRVLEDADECHSILHEYLRWRSSACSRNEDERQDFEARFRKWDSSQILEVLMHSMDTIAIEPGILLQSLRLSRAILDGQTDCFTFDTFEEKPAEITEIPSLDDIWNEVEIAKKNLEENEEANDPLPRSERNVKIEDEQSTDKGDGWQMWEGPWIAKPIGVI